MNLNSSIRALALLSVFAATVAAFSSTAHAAPSLLSSEDASLTQSQQDEIDAATLRGQFDAIVDMRAVFVLPPDIYRNSFSVMADMARLMAGFMRDIGMPIGVAYFEARASIFDHAAALYDETPAQ